MTEISEILAEEGVFSEFLRSRHISQSTAYDLIRDYKRWMKLPVALQQSAKRNHVDLAERRYSSIINYVLPAIDLDKLSEEKADEVVRIIDASAKRGQREPVRLAGLLILFDF